MTNIPPGASFDRPELSSSQTPAAPPPEEASRAWRRFNHMTRPTLDERELYERHTTRMASGAGATAEPAAPPSRVPPVIDDGEPLVDVSLLVDYVRFIGRALGRHRLGALLTLLLTTAAVVGVAMVWPRTYQIDGRLLVQRSSLVSSLVNPGRTLARDGNLPTVGAQEVVHSRENLLAIMHGTDLIAEWARTRPQLLRLKDRAMEMLAQTPTENQRVDAMVGLLEARLQVGTGDEGTISFVLKWPDPVMGQKIVDQAMQRYLEFRRVTEISAITDSISILDKSAGTVEAQVAATLGELPAPAATVSRPRTVRSVPIVAGPPAEMTVRLARLRSELDARQQEVARLDGLRTQQLSEAQARLSAALTIYTNDHPTVGSLRQTVARLGSEPPELTAARAEARRLEGEYDALSTTITTATARAEQSRLTSQSYGAVETYRPAEGGPDPIALRLTDQMAELAAVRARASAARAELASAQAGFKYQYAVVRPPQVPRAPIAPNIVAMVLAGLVASLLLAFAYAIVADLAGGRVLEAWQAERLVRAPIALRIPTL